MISYNITQGQKALCKHEAATMKSNLNTSKVTRTQRYIDYFLDRADTGQIVTVKPYKMETYLTG